MRGACSLCLFRTFSKCCNKTCTTAVCGRCKQNENYLCQNCKENGVVFNWRNRLRGARKRKADSDPKVEHGPAKRITITIDELVSQEYNEPMDMEVVQIEDNEDSEPDSQEDDRVQCDNCLVPEVEHSPANRITTTIDEEVSQELFQPIDMEESEVEENDDPEPESQQDDGGVQCENCKQTFGRLMYHLKRREHENCLNYYFAKYNCASLENLKKKIRNENRKKARQTQGRRRELELRRNVQGSMIAQANAFNKECHDILSVPCVSCGCVPSKGLQVIEVASVAEEVSPESLQTYQVDGQVYICKICDKILKDKERKDSLYDCLVQLAEVAQGAEVFSKLVFEDDNIIHSVIFPKKDSTEIHEHNDNLDRAPTKVLIQKGRGLIDIGDLSVSEESIQLLAQQHSVHMAKLLANLYIFQNQKMKKIEDKIARKESHLGLVMNNKVHTPLLDDNQTMYIEDIKGTDAYIRSNIKANKYMQEQNGVNHLNISIPLFKGIVEDERLAATLLRIERGLKVRAEISFEENGLERYSYIIPCNEHCNQNCTNYHKSVLEEAVQLNCGTRINENLTICRYVQSVANILINKVIAKNSDYYDAHLKFKQDGSVYLDCSVWIKELEAMNIDGICARDMSILPEIFENLERFMDTFQLIQGCQIEMKNEPQTLRIIDVENLSDNITNVIEDLDDNFRQATLLGKQSLK